MRALIERSIARGVAHGHIPAIHHLAYLYGCRQGKSSDASSGSDSAAFHLVAASGGVLRNPPSWHRYGLCLPNLASAAVVERHIDVDDYRTA